MVYTYTDTGNISGTLLIILIPALLSVLMILA